MLRNNVKTYMYVLNYTIEGLDRPEWLGKICFHSFYFYANLILYYKACHTIPRIF